MQSTKLLIMHLLNWDELQYGEFQYKTGTQYLQAYIPHDPAGIDMLIESRIFWNWWKNHWLQRDEEFLKDAQVRHSHQALIVSMYICTHCPDTLVGQIRPQAVVLADSYSKMIGNLIDATQCQL